MFIFIPQLENICKFLTEKVFQKTISNNNNNKKKNDNNNNNYNYNNKHRVQYDCCFHKYLKY